MCIKEISIKNWSYFIKGKKLETKNVLIDEKNYKNFHCKSIKMLSLYYHELLVNIEGHEWKISLIIHDYMLNKVLNKIKEILDNEKFDSIKILIDRGDKLPGDITLKMLWY